VGAGAGSRLNPASVDEDAAAWRSQLEAMIEDVQSWTGNHVAVIEQAEAEVGRPL
jgi:hypothetical protein